MKKVVVYSKDYCPFCVRAKELLRSKGVDFEEIAIDKRPEEKEIMIERSGGRKTVPQIFIDDFHVGGCDDLFGLDSEGQLDDLLGLSSSKTEEMINHHQLIILGSGPAGYTAAIYASRANLSPIVLSGTQKGGQLTTTTEVENFPGFPDGIDGNELMVRIERQAMKFGTEVVYGEVTQVDLTQRPFKVFQGEKQYTCDALIIATGSSARYLGLESESKYLNRGVSGCATCDGFFFKDKRVVVVGGGDTALEDANYLSRICEKVYVIHRRDEFRASQPMRERTMNNDKIEVLWYSVVNEVVGNDKDGVTGVIVENVKTGVKKEIAASGMFVAIGHTPNTSIFKGVLDTDANGYLVPVSRSTRMNIEGVFACGDVVDSIYQQAITAAGSGCMAAMDAERWLAENE